MGTIEGYQMHAKPGHPLLWWKALPVLLAALLLASCKDGGTVEPAGVNNDSLSLVRVLVNGTYPYNCEGYCIEEVSVSSNDIVYLASGIDTVQYAPLLRRAGISRQEWSDLVNSIDLKTLEQLDTVSSRVGATSNGNEWLEIRTRETPTRETRKRIVFSYGDQVPEFQTLLMKLRAIRSRMKI